MKSMDGHAARAQTLPLVCAASLEPLSPEVSSRWYRAASCPTSRPVTAKFNGHAARRRSRQSRLMVTSLNEWHDGHASSPTFCNISRELAVSAVRWLISPSHPSCAVRLTKNRGLQLYEIPEMVLRENILKNAVWVFTTNLSVNSRLRLVFSKSRRPDSWPLSSDTLLITVTFSRPERRISPAPWPIWLVSESRKPNLIGWRSFLSKRVLRTRLVTLDWRLRLPRQRYLMRYGHR